MLDKPARLIIRLLFGFVSVSRKKVKVLRRQCCLIKTFQINRDPAILAHLKRVVPDFRICSLGVSKSLGRGVDL